MKDCKFSHKMQNRRGTLDMAAHDLLAVHHTLKLTTDALRGMVGSTCKVSDCGTDHCQEAIAIEDVRTAVVKALNVVNESRGQSEKIHRAAHGTEGEIT